MKNKTVFSLAMLTTAAVLFAHHGTGVSYDSSKPVTFKAVVTEFHYANPHPQLFLTLKMTKVILFTGVASSILIPRS